MGKNDMSVRQLYTKHRVGESFSDYALHFDRFFFRHRHSYMKNNDRMLTRAQCKIPSLAPYAPVK